VSFASICGLLRLQNGKQTARFRKLVYRASAAPLLRRILDLPQYLRDFGEDFAVAGGAREDQPPNCSAGGGHVILAG
jgi:hypothetical protein